MHQAGCQIAAIAGIDRNERIVALVEFVQMPFRRRRMQMRHTLPGQSDGAFRHNHRQPLDQAAFVLRQAAGFEPENSDGQCAVDGRLRLFIVHSNHG